MKNNTKDIWRRSSRKSPLKKLVRDRGGLSFQEFQTAKEVYKAVSAGQNLVRALVKHNLRYSQYHAYRRWHNMLAKYSEKDVSLL